MGQTPQKILEFTTENVQKAVDATFVRAIT